MVGAALGAGDQRGVTFQWVQSFTYARCVSPRYLLYNLVPIINNSVLYILKCVKRVDSMFSVLTKIKKNKKSL